MTTKTRLLGAFPLPILLILPALPIRAQTSEPAAPTAVTPPPGAMPGDQDLTCEMIATERTAINDAVTATALKKQKSARVKKGLLGFAKTMATAMVPGAALLGGNSMIGSLAAQGAGQSAVDALGDAAAKPGTAPAAAQPSDEQATRLARLDSIGRYRQCTAA